MIKKIVAVFTLLFSGIAHAAVIDFDDVTTSGYAALSSNYNGYNWGSSWYAHSDERYANVYRNTYGSTSGDYAAFNGGGQRVMRLTSLSLFDFTGAYFSAWAWRDDFWNYAATSITLQGYRQNALVESLTMQLSADQFDWLQADFQDVDEIHFISSGSGKWWLMDDLTVNASGALLNPSSVSSPGSIVLIGMGLMVLLFIPRRVKLVNSDISPRLS